ncbi:MAG: RNA polymerase sigma factor [Pseudomonadota bacterium]
MSIGMDAMAERRDNTALDTFIARQSDFLALANSLVKNRAIAEELVQDSWVQWSSRSYPVSDAIPIFRRIIMNLAFDWHKKTDRECVRMKAYALLFDNAPDTERIIIARQDLMNVILALQSLPAKSLRAFRLSRVEGYTYQQIADEMGVATSTAYKLIADALLKLAMLTDK